ncbi:unnamed protein product [Brugia timori]|uniref:Uncharacterized protein n=1 Tax=Brugia timori TaxID=42155 RepID=A0A3P7YYL7_9BILA|nr:unnamed protein product [Brugia timori]
MTIMLSSAKGMNTVYRSGGGGDGTESPRKLEIFTANIDGAGHVPSASIDLNNATSTTTAADSILFSLDNNEKVIVFSDAAEKCATMVLSAVFEGMSLKLDNTCPLSSVVPEPDFVTTSKKLLEGTKFNASKHCAYSLSKSDLIELKRSIVKSDFKPVQDPLSISKLRKNCSVDYHPWHSPIFEISSLDSSRYICESLVVPLITIHGIVPYLKLVVWIPHDISAKVLSIVTKLVLPSLSSNFRLLVAALLCCCFIALSVSTSNMAVALICMTSCTINGYKGDLQWRSEQVMVTHFNPLLS